MLGKTTLVEIYRFIGHSPFVAERQGRKAWFLGVGPKGAMVGWWAGSDEIREWPANETGWIFQIKLKG